jgi:hypothetical protein
MANHGYCKNCGWYNKIDDMNLIILGIMALCGASLNKIAIVAIILGVFDVLRDVFEDISAHLKEYTDIYKQNQEKEDE